jgi:hypothetical protein
MDRVALLEAQTFSMKSTLPPLVENPDGLPPMIFPGGVLDLSKAALGYKIDPDGDDPDLVRIYAGEIDRIAVAQTDVTVANNGYVYVRRTISNNTMLITTAASVPANDATYLYYRLHRFTVTAGAASILSIYRPFDIYGGNVVTDIRYDATTKQLQKKTIAVPTWTMIEGGQAEECP